MATESSEPGTEKLLEFCLLPWFALTEDDITESRKKTASKVAKLLTATKRFHVFENFVNSLPDRILEVFSKSEDFRRGLIELRYSQERYDEVCELIRGGTFSDGSDLIGVWDHAQYAIKGRQYGKTLTSLQRFRIRKKNPPPPSIYPEGARQTRNLNVAAKAVMEDWFQKHLDAPYPTHAKREELAQKTGLTQAQIKTWFANARRRRLVVKDEKTAEKKKEERAGERKHCGRRVVGHSSDHFGRNGGCGSCQDRAHQSPECKALPCKTVRQQLSSPPAYVTPDTTTEPSPLRALTHMCQRFPQPLDHCVRHYNQGIQHNSKKTCKGGGSSLHHTSLAALLAAPVEENADSEQCTTQPSGSLPAASPVLSQCMSTQHVKPPCNVMTFQILHPSASQAATVHTLLPPSSSSESMPTLNLSQSATAEAATAPTETAREYSSPLMLSAPWRSPSPSWYSPSSVFSPPRQVKTEDYRSPSQVQFFTPPNTLAQEAMAPLHSPSSSYTVTPFASPPAPVGPFFLFYPDLFTEHATAPADEAQVANAEDLRIKDGMSYWGKVPSMSMHGDVQNPESMAFPTSANQMASASADQSKPIAEEDAANILLNLAHTTS